MACNPGAPRHPYQFVLQGGVMANRFIDEWPPRWPDDAATWHALVRAAPANTVLAVCFYLAEGEAAALSRWLGRSRIEHTAGRVAKLASPMVYAPRGAQHTVEARVLELLQTGKLPDGADEPTLAAMAAVLANKEQQAADQLATTQRCRALLARACRSGDEHSAAAALAGLGSLEP